MAQRLNSSQAHIQHQNEKKVEDLKNSAHKVATVLYKTVRDGKNTHPGFDSANGCAKSVNSMFNVQEVFLAGAQLQAAHRRDEYVVALLQILTMNTSSYCVICSILFWQ